MKTTPIPTGLLRTPQGFYVLENDSHLSRWCESHGRLDIAEGQIEFYKRFIPVGGTVIDAGASLGDCTLTYAKLVGPSGTVLAFEPNPLSFAALALNFVTWTNVVPANFALSDRMEIADITISENAGASFITPSQNGDVKCVTMDSYVDDLTRCDLMHLDVEGFETRAIMGSLRVIERFKPAIVLEINHACLARNGITEVDVLNLIAEIGYEWEELEPGHGPHLPQRDILATPNEPRRL